MDDEINFKIGDRVKVDPELVEKVNAHLKIISKEIAAMADLAKGKKQGFLALDAIVCIYAGVFGPMLKGPGDVEFLLNITLKALSEAYNQAPGRDHCMELGISMVDEDTFKTAMRTAMKNHHDQWDDDDDDKESNKLDASAWKRKLN